MRRLLRWLLGLEKSVKIEVTINVPQIHIFHHESERRPETMVPYQENRPTECNKTRDIDYIGNLEAKFDKLKETEAKFGETR